MLISSLAECARILKAPYTGENVFFSSISIDTRTLKEDALFIAIQGEKWDGHDFIECARQKKAAAVIIQTSTMIHIPYLRVPDTRIALGLLAQHHRQQFSLPIIALTGSCGKTTTKEFLSNILRGSGNVLASPKSFNNDIGLPLTLLQLHQNHHFVVLEMHPVRSSGLLSSHNLRLR
jgi:UDP-N-acetylmuramoyl-tripeptide--D-alanyl-D-alanine ligase